MRRFFQIVSGVFNPLLLPFFGTIFLFQLGLFQLYPLQYKLFIIAIVLINMCLLPLAGIYLLKLNGHVSDFDVSNKKERVFPYIITVVSSIAGIVLIYRYNMPWITLKLYIGSMLATIIAFVITFKWKISVHTIAFGCIIASAFLICLNQAKNPLLFFVILLLFGGLQASSRLYLKAHTVWQVTAGFFLGLLSVSATFFLLP